MMSHQCLSKNKQSATRAKHSLEPYPPRYGYGFGWNVFDFGILAISVTRTTKRTPNNKEGRTFQHPLNIQFS